MAQATKQERGLAHCRRELIDEAWSPAGGRAGFGAARFRERRLVIGHCRTFCCSAPSAPPAELHLGCRCLACCSWTQRKVVPSCAFADVGRGGGARHASCVQRVRPHQNFRRSAVRLTISATALAESRVVPMCPWRSMRRKSGPEDSSSTSPQSCTAITGQVSRMRAVRDANASSLPS